MQCILPSPNKIRYDDLQHYETVENQSTIPNFSTFDHWNIEIFQSCVPQHLVCKVITHDNACQRI